MKNFTRRHFIMTGLTGAAALSSGLPLYAINNKNAKIKEVALGETGINLSQLAFGTGTVGGGHTSDFTRMGIEKFLRLAHYAYDKGIKFLDVADSYGTHQSIRELFKEIPRDKFSVMTKIWTSNNKWNTVKPVSETLERFKKETSSDYFDIVLLHCMLNENWPEEKKMFMDGLSEAKVKGIVKTVGVSCHDFGALKVAAENPWVDVILARINHMGAVCDSKPENVMPVLEKAKNNGKGIIGMKIYGAGQLTSEEHREKSMNYVWNSGNVHSMTIGMNEIEYIDDAVERISRITKKI